MLVAILPRRYAPCNVPGSRANRCDAVGGGSLDRGQYSIIHFRLSNDT